MKMMDDVPNMSQFAQDRQRTMINLETHGAMLGTERLPDNIGSNEALNPMMNDARMS